MGVGIVDKNTKARLVRQIADTLKALKKEIGDEYRATEEDTVPGMQVTFATTTGVNWVYQTGDNSYSGPCYSFPFWSVVYLYRRSNCVELAKQVVEEWEEGFEYV
jgi:hypothetical protein